MLPIELDEDDADAVAVVEARVDAAGLELTVRHYVMRPRRAAPQCVAAIPRYVVDEEPVGYQSALGEVIVEAENLAASLDVGERKEPPRALMQSCYLPGEIRQMTSSECK